MSLATYFAKGSAPAPTEEIPAGFTLRTNVITREQEVDALLTLNAQPWDDKTLKRRVQHYGYRYDYARTPPTYIGPLPEWALTLYDAISAPQGGAPPNQIIVNEYKPGQGIAAHTDHESYFGDTITVLSLGSPCTLILRSKDTPGLTRTIRVPPRSVYQLQGEARYRWTHEIPARTSDTYDGAKETRGTRVSVTYRTVKDAASPLDAKVKSASSPSPVAHHGRSKLLIRKSQGENPPCIG